MTNDPLTEISGFLARYLQCTEHQRTVLALWALHTYCFYTAQATPFLSIQSAQKQSGKTLCLQLLHLLCENSALTSGGIRASQLAVPMQDKPISALLLDECQATVGSRSRPKAPVLRALLSGSFHLGLGYGNIAEERNAFLPKAFAGSAPLPQELADRSIPIILEALVDQESEIDNQKSALPARFDLRRAIDEALPLRQRLNHWADEHLLPVLDQLPPLPRSAFPDNLSPRQQDICEPLLQLAGLIGGPWPARAVSAFAVIFDVQTAFELRTNLQLLADIRDCFAHYNFPDRLTTASLLDWIYSLPARPWDLGGRFSAHTLSRLLHPFGIHPRVARVAQPPSAVSSPVEVSSTARGYLLEDLSEAWQKYLGPQNHKPPEVELAAAGQKLHSNKPETANRKSKIASVDAVCYDVTDFRASAVPDPAGPPPNPGDPGNLSRPAAKDSNDDDDGDDGNRASQSEIENQKSEIPTKPWPITCSPECLAQRETKADSSRDKAKASSHMSPILSFQEILEQTNALRRKLLAHLGQEEPETEAKNQQPEISNQRHDSQDPEAQESEIKNLNSEIVSDAVAVPAPDHNPQDRNPNATNKSPEIEAQEYEIQRAAGRLAALYQELRVQGGWGFEAFQACAANYAPEDLHAALDWVAAHPEWSKPLRYRHNFEFIAAFQNGPARAHDRRFAPGPDCDSRSEF